VSTANLMQCGWCPPGAAIAEAVAAERKRIAKLLDSAGARYQKQVGWPASASELLRETP
jgi:hypothetical protein